MSKSTSIFKFGAVAVALALTLGAVACSDDGDGDALPPAAATEDPAATGPDATTEATSATGATGETVDVTAVDYAFEGLPDTVEAGTAFTMVNQSTAEVHELVAIRIPDGETRSVAELLALPEEELAELGEVEPSMVIVAPPGGEGLTVFGEPALTEPGRYLFACFIPIGADPDEFLDASQGAEGSSDAEGGPPHFTEGMFAEVTVE